MRRIYISEIDLHFHAGAEREPGGSMRDHIEFAVRSNRKVLGVLDHLGLYFPTSTQSPHSSYTPDMDGYLKLLDEIASFKDTIPGLTVLVGTEIRVDCFDRAAPYFVDQLDYFAAEVNEPRDSETYTEFLLLGTRLVQEYRERYGKPGFLAHPFRGRLHWDLHAKDRSRSKLEQLRPLEESPDPGREATDYFEVDVPMVCDAFRKAQVPVEINQADFRRVEHVNSRPYYQRLLKMYELLRDEGVEFVVGSDLHHITDPTHTPFVACDMLGVRTKDIQFIRPFLDDLPS